MTRETSLEAAFTKQKKELIRIHYKQMPGEFRYFLAHEKRYLADFKLIHSLYEDGSILELGAHPFIFSCILKGAGFPVTCVDLDPFRVMQHLQRHNLSIVKCDIERQNLPFVDGSFDYVLFNEILEHLRVDPMLALSESNRVLKKGGIIILTTPNLYFIKTVAKFLIGRGFNDPIQEFGKLRSLGHMGHVREYSYREVETFLKIGGFEVLAHKYEQYNYPRNAFGLLAFPFLRLLPFFRGYQVVVARKAFDAPRLVPLGAA